LEMVRLALFLSAALVAFGQAAGRVDGRVVTIAGDPLGKAWVTLTRPSGTPCPGIVFPTSQSMIVETGSDGTFSFTDLEPSQYSLRVERSGYAPIERFRTFFIDPGTASAAFTLKLAPQAVITGRITDADGDPLENAGVSALRESDEENRKQWVATGSARTDWQGNFRISVLPPGRYIVSAGARNYGVTTFYPGSWDMASAVAIVADAGSEHSGIDIGIRRDGPPRFAIRGKAVRVTSGSVARGQILTLKTRDGRGGGGPAGSVRDDGSFEIKNIQAGTYVIQTLDAFRASGGVVSSAWTDKGQVEVTVTNHDEEGVLLAIRPAMTIAGIVTMEDGTKLTARPRVVLVAHDVPFNGSEPWARVREDGSFEIGNLGPVLYDVQPAGLPPGVAAKSIRFGGRDVTRTPIDLTGGSEDQLEIVLSSQATN
jgi:hypothetical protein